MLEQKKGYLYRESRSHVKSIWLNDAEVELWDADKVRAMLYHRCNTDVIHDPNLEKYKSDLEFLKSLFESGKVTLKNLTKEERERLLSL